MPQLTPEQLAQLDKNIKDLIAKGAGQDVVTKYASDFKAKYDLGDVKKKGVAVSSVPWYKTTTGDGQSADTTATKPVEKPAQDFGFKPDWEKTDIYKNLYHAPHAQGDIALGAGVDAAVGGLKLPEAKGPEPTDPIKDLLDPARKDATKAANAFTPLAKNEMFLSGESTKQQTAGNKLKFDLDYKDYANKKKDLEDAAANHDQMRYYAENYAFKDGLQAKQYALDKIAASGGTEPKGNETYDLAKRKAIQYGNTVEDIEKNRSLEEYFLNKARQKDPHFNDQVTALEAADPNHADITDWYRRTVGDAKMFQIVRAGLNDPDVRAYIDAPGVNKFGGTKNLYQDEYYHLANNLLTEFPEGGKNLIENEISRKRQELGKNSHWATFDDKNFHTSTDQVAADLYRNNPTKLEIYQQNRDEILKKIDVPGALNRFEGGIEKALSGIKETFSNKSIESDIKSSIDEQAANVSAGEKGAYKIISEVADMGGFLAGMAATGNVAKGLTGFAGGLSGSTVFNSSPALAGAINKSVTASTFLGKALKEGAANYPGEPGKAILSGYTKAASYVAMINLLPTEKIAEVMGAGKKSVGELIDAISDENITAAAKKDLGSTWFKRTGEAAGIFTKDYGKSLAEILAITKFNQSMDKMLGMDPTLYSQIHPEHEDEEVLKTFAVANLLPSGIAAYHDYKMRNFTKEAVWDVANNPKRAAKTLYENGSFAGLSKEQSADVLKNLLLLNKVKAALDEQGLSKPRQKAFLLQTANEMILERQAREAQKKADDIEEPVLKAKEEEKVTEIKGLISAGQKMKEDIINGEEMQGSKLPQDEPPPEEKKEPDAGKMPDEQKPEPKQLPNGAEEEKPAPTLEKEVMDKISGAVQAHNKLQKTKAEKSFDLDAVHQFGDYLYVTAKNHHGTIANVFDLKGNTPKDEPKEWRYENAVRDQVQKLTGEEPVFPDETDEQRKNRADFNSPEAKAKRAIAAEADRADDEDMTPTWLQTRDEFEKSGYFKRLADVADGTPEEKRRQVLSFHAAEVKANLDNGELEEAVKDKKITAERAATILKEAGHKVPRSIKDLLSEPEEPKDLTPEEVILDEAKKGKLDKVYTDFLKGNEGAAKAVLLNYAKQKHGISDDGSELAGGGREIENKAVNDAVDKAYPDKEAVIKAINKKAGGGIYNQPYTSLQGKYTVTNDENGKRVIKYANGKVVRKIEEKHNYHLLQHAKAYNYNVGDKASVDKAPDFKDSQEAATWITEHSSNPAEIASIWLQTDRQPASLSAVEKIIAEHGIGKVTQKSFEIFNDRSNITDAIAKTYFSKKGTTLDEVAFYASANASDFKVTPEDVAAFMIAHPWGIDPDGMVKTEAHYQAETKFEQLTGIPLSSGNGREVIAKLAASQHVTADKFDNKGPEAFGGMPEEERLKWLQEMSEQDHFDDDQNNDNFNDNEQDLQHDQKLDGEQPGSQEDITDFEARAPRNRPTKDGKGSDVNRGAEDGGDTADTTEAFKEQIKKIKAYAAAGEANRKEIRRLSPSAERGRLQGGSRNVEATLLLASGEGGRGQIKGREAQEQAIEKYAKAEGIWLGDKIEEVPEIDTVEPGIGTFIDEGMEAQVYVDPDNPKLVNKAIRVSDRFKDITGDNDNAVLDFLDNRISIHNSLFPSTPYKIIGFARNESGHFLAIAQQPFVQKSRLATKAEIDSEFKKMGFTGVRYTYEDDNYSVTDMNPNNVLVDDKGNIHFIDTQIEPKYKVNDEAIDLSITPDTTSSEDLKDQAAEDLDHIFTEGKKDPLKEAKSTLARAQKKLREAEDKITATKGTQGGMFGEAAQGSMFGMGRDEAKEILDPLRAKVNEAKVELQKLQAIQDEEDGQADGQIDMFATKATGETAESGGSVADKIEAWVKEQRAAGMSDEDIQDLLRKRTAMSEQEADDYVNQFATGVFKEDTPREESADTTLKPVEFPELLQIARELAGGKYPEIKKFISALGYFSPGGKKIVLRADMFKPEHYEDLVKLLAHEVGHWVDMLASLPADETMRRGNILGRIGVMKDFMRKFLPEQPGGPGELTKAEMDQIADDEKKNYTPQFREEDEYIEKITGLTPEDVLAIWNDVQAGVNNPDLLDYIQRLGTAEKKRIVIAAMKGVIDDQLKKFQKVEKVPTGNKIQVPIPDDGWKKRAEDRIRDEIRKRKLWEEKKIYEEAWKLSKEWRPIDEKLASAKDLKYRHSSVEIYADMISVLFNSPGTLEKKAPMFFKAFMNYLDEKPMFKAIYDDLMHLMTDPEAMKEQRAQNTVAGYMMAQNKRAIALKIDKRNESLWQRFKREFISTFTPLGNLLDNTKNGKGLSQYEQTRNAYEQMEMWKSKAALLLDNYKTETVEPLRKAGVDLADAGQLVQYIRNMSAAREGKANPLGFQTDDVNMDLIARVFNKYDAKQQAIIREKLARFYELGFGVIEEANDSDLMTSEQMATATENKYNYGTFKPVKYITDLIQDARMLGIQGGLSEIANPYMETMAKMVMIQKAALKNKAIVTAANALAQIHPESWVESPLDFRGNPKIKLKTGEAYVWFKRKGRRTVAITDKYVSDAFNREPPEKINVAADWLAKMAVPLRLAWTKYNPGFIYIVNPFKDSKRAVKNTLAILSANGALQKRDFALLHTEYAATWWASYNDTRSLVKKVPSDVIKRMLEYGAINPESALFAAYDADYNGMANLFMHYDFMGRDQYGITKSKKAYDDVVKVLSWLPNYLLANPGAHLEFRTKIAMFKVLEKRLGPQAAAYYTRNYIGTPNYSERFGAKKYVSWIPFTSVILQGLRTDSDIATGPKTRGAYWLYMALSIGIPALLTAAAKNGLFDKDSTEKGKRLSDWFKKIGAYTRQNYMVIPTGFSKDGKAQGVKLALDDAEAFVWNNIQNLTEDKSLKNKMRGVIESVTNRLPDYKSGIDLYSKWWDFAAKDMNPYDDFRHRNVISEQNFKIGGWKADWDMIKWSMNKMGIRIPQYDEGNQTTRDKVLAVLPAVRRFYFETNIGEYEEMKKVAEKQDREAAIRSSGIDDALKDALNTQSDAVIKGVSPEVDRGQLILDAFKQYSGKDTPETEQDGKDIGTIASKAAVLLKKDDVKNFAQSAKEKMYAMQIINAQSNNTKKALVDLYIQDATVDEANEFIAFLKDNNIYQYRQ